MTLNRFLAFFLILQLILIPSTLHAQGPLGLHAFGYDGLNRLVSADHPLGTVPELADEQLSYDSLGNRVSSHLSAAYQHNAANQLLEDDGFRYTYDANGNLTAKADKSTAAETQYTYDAENQLIRIDFPGGKYASYAYDGLGRRIQKDVDGVITKYVYDNEDILLEYDGANQLQAHYTHGPGIDEPLILTRGAQNLFYHADGLGSITALTDSAGSVVERYTYDSFGNLTITDAAGSALSASAFSNPYAFTGREFDSESRLYYYRARYYDARIGRFLQEDPLGFVGADENFYAYVFNNPVAETDSTGLLLDTILDIAFIGYDLFGLVASRNICEIEENRAALAADITASFIPGLTGLGLVVRGSFKGSKAFLKARSFLLSNKAINKQIRIIGDKFVEASFEISGKRGGASRAVYKKIIDSNGKTKMLFKDSFDEFGNFEHRAFKFPKVRKTQ